MSKIYIEGKIFEKENFSENELPKGDYEHCTFINCIFSEADISNINFSECEFNGCNMSMAKIKNTAFRDIQFKACKLLGLHFENTNPFLFSVGFENCLLNLSSFYKLRLKNTKFTNCSIHEVEFTEADLTNATFKNCDLSGAIFDNTVLEKVDFRSSYHFSINPELNRIKKAKFSLTTIVGLLHKYNIEIDN